MAIPPGHFGLLKSRSGISLKHGIDVQAGVIDSDYRGEICVILENNSDQDFTITSGDRISQMIIMNLPTVDIKEVKSLDITERGTNGFGNTGINEIATDNKFTNKTDYHHHPTQLRRSLRINAKPSAVMAASLTQQPKIQTLYTDSNTDLPSPTCNIELSTNPFYDTENISFQP